MPSKRQKSVRGIISSTRTKSKSHKTLTHADKLAFISRYQPVPDATNKSAVTRQYKKLRRTPVHLEKKVDKETRDRLKDRGFYTTKRGVVIDVPRDAKRKQIPHTKMSVAKDGTVIFRNHKRRDYIVGFTKKDKAEFAKDPNAFIKRKTEEMRAKYPTLGKRKLQVRLQWGAYQATKDFYPGYFTKRYGHVPERDRKRVNDRLTGLHIVVHIPRKENRGKRKATRRRS